MSKLHKQKWDFSQITDYIYLGADMCCGGDHYDFLCHKMGIKADAAVVEEQLEKPSKLLEEFLWLKVLDHEAPNKLQLDIGVGFIRAVVKNKQKVYVHCRVGHGRSPTLVAAYLKSTGMTAAEAIEKIKQARPEAHLNEAQMKAVEEYEF